MRISDWSSDVCSSDLLDHIAHGDGPHDLRREAGAAHGFADGDGAQFGGGHVLQRAVITADRGAHGMGEDDFRGHSGFPSAVVRAAGPGHDMMMIMRSEEHTCELKSPMRISYAVVCLNNKIVAQGCNRKTYADHNLHATTISY